MTPNTWTPPTAEDVADAMARAEALAAAMPYEPDPLVTAGNLVLGRPRDCLDLAESVACAETSTTPWRPRLDAWRIGFANVARRHYTDPANTLPRCDAPSPPAPPGRGRTVARR